MYIVSCTNDLYMLVTNDNNTISTEVRLKKLGEDA